MEQYISKSALVAEIYKLKKSHDNWSCMGKCFHQEYENLLSFLDTLEVKEVDLDKETTYYLLYEHCSPLNEIMHKADLKSEMQYHKDIENAFKAGFELGLKAQHSELTWEDISVLRKIMAEYRRQTSNEMLVLNDEDYCKEVLNRFKVQKGEEV